jgi:hypothetical protein
MLKKLMSRSLKVFTVLSSGISIFGVVISIQDIKLKDKFLKIQERNEILEKQINELKIDELKNEVTKNKVEYFRSSLEESQSKIIKEVENIQKLDVKTDEQKEVLKSHLDNFNTENENMQNMLSEIIKFFNDNNKFTGDNVNIIEILTNFIHN